MGLLTKAGDAGPVPRKSGFLERAESSLEAGKIEQICIDRLARLPEDGKSAFAALTILKACFPSTAELILRRTETGTYSIAESVGVSENGCEDETVAIDLPPDGFTVEGFCPFDAAALRIPSMAPDARAFAYRLAETAETLFVLVDKEEDGQKLASVARTLRARGRLFSARPMASGGCGSGPALPAAPGEYLVIALTDADAVLCGKAADLLKERLGDTGDAAALSAGNVAVRLRPDLDRELFAHRLIDSLKRSPDFAAHAPILAAEGSAADAGEAAELLRPFS